MNISRREFMVSTIAATVPLSTQAQSSTSITLPRLRANAIQKIPTTSDILNQFAPSGTVSVALVDLQSGAVIDAVHPNRLCIPASVVKLASGAYALEQLGAEYRFQTHIYGDESRKAWHLSGGGDPTLDTAQLAQMASQAGHSFVAEQISYEEAPWGVARISQTQPEYASYNPGFSSLNLNYNRVLVAWLQKQSGLGLSVSAHSQDLAVPAPNIGVLLRSGSLPANIVFQPASFSGANGVELWLARTESLTGRGQRWLPVRDPARYAAEVLKALAQRNLARSNVETFPEVMKMAVNTMLPSLAVHHSQALTEIVKNALYYSTNLTAELVGVAATLRRLSALSIVTPPFAQHMKEWLMARFPQENWQGMRIENYSGLSIHSRMSALQSARIVAGLYQHSAQPLWSILPQYDLILPMRYRTSASADIEVRAKTGTMLFARGLSGVLRISERFYGFAIFSTDYTQRQRMDAAFNPHHEQGTAFGRSWISQARKLETALLQNWVRMQIR